MTTIMEIANKSKQPISFNSSVFSSFSKFCWYIFLFAFIVFVILFYDIHSYSYAEVSRILVNLNFQPSIDLSFLQSITTTTVVSTTISTTTFPGIVIDIDDRIPSYRLATDNGNKPYADGDRAQAKVLEELHLYETCQRDPSTIVVDVGAFLGDFGLYAAACGCTVYIFEVQPHMVNLIRSSINHNGFPSSRVRLLHNAVSDVPSGTTVRFSAVGGETSITDGPLEVQTVRLDDIEWPSSSIFMLKIDVEGFEMNVLRSAKNLFAQNRIRHLIFEYTAWMTDRAPQETLLLYVKNDLKAKFMYALHRTGKIIYGPLLPRDLKIFHRLHKAAHLQTDVYAVFDDKANASSIQAQRYQAHRRVA